ncbi:MAG: amidohydrolase [Ignavibacteriales bacterium]|nr:amidohydrolase [Ignavibacteriales bacterium]
MKKIILSIFILFALRTNAQNINSIYPDLEKLCKDLHSDPELSLKEERTSARIAQELKNLGFEVTERFGGYGVVGILKNGEGKKILIRTDLDALPVKENTSLLFTSKNNGVMHACGHDVHMSVFIGTARMLAENKNKWKGTIMMIGQPAEEIGKGARMMLDAGLYEKFGVPDYALAIHVSPAAKVGTDLYCPGYAMSDATSITIKVKGIGGHGASPQLAVDPIVMTAQMILSYQTIISRETSPFDPAVITVGYIKGGTKHNIIPDEVEMGLTVRTFNDDVKKKILNSIKTKTEKIAESFGLSSDKLPEIIISEQTPAVYNNHELVNRLVPILKKEFGESNIIQSQPWSASEDFSQYGRTKEKVPSFMIWVGSASAEDWAKKQGGWNIPFVHSPNFKPDFENTIKSGVRTVLTSTMELLTN